MNAYRALMRRKLLEEIYDGLSEEDKRTFVRMTFEDKGCGDIVRALNRQDMMLDDIHRRVSRQTWLSDFSSNIAGNAIWDSLVWIGTRLFGKP